MYSHFKITVTESQETSPKKSPLPKASSPEMLQQSRREPAPQDRLHTKLAEANEKATVVFLHELLILM